MYESASLATWITGARLPSPQGKNAETAWFAAAPFWMVPSGRLFLLLLPLALLPVLAQPRTVTEKDRGITPR